MMSMKTCSIHLNEPAALCHIIPAPSTLSELRLSSSFLANSTRSSSRSLSIKAFPKPNRRPITRSVLMNRESERSMETKMATKLSVLLVCDAFNSMAQRTALKIRERGHDAMVHIFKDGDAMIGAVEGMKPDVILCPYLTKRVPAKIYQGDVPCLIIHPGIEGDRGMSSIDWALQEGQREWGVTILQAEEEMDAGPIWATSTFQIHRYWGEPPTKSSLYRIECVDAAMRCIDEVLHNLQHNIPPRPLDYSNPSVRGCLRPKLTQADRRLDWTLPAEDLARVIRAGDSQPGTQSVVAGEKCLLFGAHVESNPPGGDLAPTALLGVRDGAVLIRCGSGTAIWISHLKRSVKSIKLPSTSVLPPHILAALPTLPSPALELPFKTFPTTFQEIFFWRRNSVTYLWFEFYNGAMSTDQCRRLAAAIDAVNADCKVLVLMGGVNYFSNGIHLNTIEAAADAAHESWQNINAINDVVERVLKCRGRVTVAALQGGAGAGGVMAAAAADLVWAHRNVVVHPSYKPMALYGSEYWTYSLPRRVGMEVAQQLVSSTDPVAAADSHKMGLVDEILAPSSVGFVESVIKRAESLARGTVATQIIESKERTVPGLEQVWQRHRQVELEHMKTCFQSVAYHQKRRNFVYKSAGNLACQAELTMKMEQPN